MQDTMTISILCPTRGRPELFGRMVQSVRDRTRGAGVQIFGYVDDDDPQGDRYDERWGSPAVPDDLFENSVHLLRGLSDGVGKAWNLMAGRSKGDLLMLANDDLVFVTEGWDELLVERINCYPDAREDKVFVAWADDGAPRPQTRVTFPFVHRRWAEVLGYFAPECFHFLWHDTWIGDVGARAGRLVFAESVTIEHRHFSFKKAEYDETYRRHRVGKENARKRAADRATYYATAGMRQAAADKLREYVERRRP